ncbi:RDD family protein [Lachnospiraceae bacterium JLR.KK008]
MKTKNNLEIKPAPGIRRGFAFLIDWYLGSAVSALPVGFLWNMQTGETTINTDVTLFAAPYWWIAGLLGLLFGAFYYYWIPLGIWKGQTLGKRLMNIRIADETGQPLPAGRLALRQLAGVMLLEGAFLLTGQYVIQMLTMLVSGWAGSILSYVMFGCFFVSVWMTFRRGKALHDLWAGSKVLDGKLEREKTI